jgi:hypothetical protein
MGLGGIFRGLLLLLQGVRSVAFRLCLGEALLLLLGLAVCLSISYTCPNALL